ncbi:hypothetical protein NGRA_0199 [Nosema granulosis]|uniref:Uncharacterized protein n=1 Tax=Nosema granulosis TaxID=83296 RepID=A0A9P6H1B6_9MICR|nr:hypothetical protein NGRA_0199 [Nosema granulosis]
MKIGKDIRYYFNYYFIKKPPGYNTDTLIRLTFRFPQYKTDFIELPVFSSRIIRPKGVFTLQRDCIKGFLPEMAFRRFTDRKKNGFVILNKKLTNIKTAKEHEKNNIYWYEKEGDYKVVFTNGTPEAYAEYVVLFFQTLLEILKSFDKTAYKNMFSAISKDKTFIKNNSLVYFKRREILFFFLKNLIVIIRKKRLQKKSLDKLKGILYSEILNLQNRDRLEEIRLLYKIHLLLRDLIKIISEFAPIKSNFEPIQINEMFRTHRFTVEKTYTFFVVEFIPIKDVNIEVYNSKLELIDEEIEFLVFRNYIIVPYKSLDRFCYLRIHIGEKYSSQIMSI